MLKRREESDTYLTSADIFIAEMAYSVAFISSRRSQVGVLSSLLFNIFLSFYLSRFSFYIYIRHLLRYSLKYNNQYLKHIWMNTQWYTAWSLQSFHIAEYHHSIRLTNIVNTANSLSICVNTQINQPYKEIQKKNLQFCV